MAKLIIEQPKIMGATTVTYRRLWDYIYIYVCGTCSNATIYIYIHIYSLLEIRNGDVITHIGTYDYLCSL